VPDPAAAEAFYTAAFGLGDKVRVRGSQSPATGFRGFTLSLVVPQPSTVDSLISTAPDGTIWKVATSAKKDTGPATRAIDGIVLILGVADMAASKHSYAGHGLAVAKSFGSKYAEFDAEPGAIKLSLYKRSGLAKDAGVTPEGTGSHRLAIGSDAGPFTDPDGFTWEAA